MIRILLCTLFLAVSFSSVAEAGIKEYWEGLKADIKATWNEGRWSAYVPTYAWHNRLTYDKKHIDKYNENTWGFGMGLTRDEGDTWHGLYAMGFKDSNRYLETFIGYGYMKNYSLDCSDKWRLGAGYALGVTQRHEYGYIPVPVPLPIASLSYKKISINAAYVPGVKNDGNVLFTWLRFDF